MLKKLHKLDKKNEEKNRSFIPFYGNVLQGWKTAEIKPAERKKNRILICRLEQALDLKLEYDIHILGHKKYNKTSTWELKFCPFYLLLSSSGHAFFLSFFCKIFDLAITKEKSRDREIALSFSGCALWKMLINFRRWMTADEGSQIFSCFG